MSTKTCHTLLAALGIASLSGATATAQDVAMPVAPDTQSPITSFLILTVPLVFVGLLFVLIAGPSGCSRSWTGRSRSRRRPSS